MNSVPVDSMKDLLTELDYLHEQRIPVDARIDFGHYSRLIYTGSSGAEVCMYYDPDEVLKPSW